MKSNVIDINPILEVIRKQRWYDHVQACIDNAKNESQRLYWTEIKLCLMFDDYLAQHGVHHPNDPVLLDQNDPM